MMGVRWSFACPLLLLAGACRRDPPPPEPAIAPPPLYPQRTAELHLGSPDGPVVAYVHPGADVVVAPADAAHVHVTASAFHLTGYADAAAFGTTPRAFVGPRRTGRLIKDMPWFDLHATLDTGESFAATHCGEVRVVEEEGTRVRVTQIRGGIEILGWAPSGAPLEIHRGPIRSCGMRELRREDDGRWMLARGTTEGDVEEVKFMPDGFARLDAAAKDGLAPLFASGGTVRWLTLSSVHTAVCVPWWFGRVREDGFVLLTRGSPIRYQGKTAFASFAARYAPEARELTIMGPHFSSGQLTRPSGEADLGGYRCGAMYGFVGAREGALRMYPGGRPPPSVLAWHPDDEELWYTSAEACEAAAKTTTAALAKDPEATPPGGLHVDCYPELEP